MIAALATAVTQIVEPPASSSPPLATSELLNYGALGILCALCVSATVYLFFTLQRERNKHLADRKITEDEHREEMKALVDRYITTSNANVKEYHVLADKITAVLESLTRRVERRGR